MYKIPDHFLWQTPKKNSSHLVIHDHSPKSSSMAAHSPPWQTKREMQTTCPEEYTYICECGFCEHHTLVMCDLWHIDINRYCTSMAKQTNSQQDIAMEYDSVLNPHSIPLKPPLNHRQSSKKQHQGRQKPCHRCNNCCPRGCLLAGVLQPTQARTRMNKAKCILGKSGNRF